MIQWFRKKSDTFVAKLILALTALSFVSLWGAGGISSFMADNPTVVRVKSMKLKADGFTRHLETEIGRMRQRMDPNLSFRDLVKAGLGLSLAQALVDRMTIEKFAKDSGFDISTEELVRAIHQEPSFKDQNGNFSRSQFEYYLSRNNMSERDLLTQLRQHVLTSQILSAPRTQALAPKALSEIIYMMQNEKRSFDFVRIEYDKMQPSGTPSTTALQEIFEEKRDSLFYPEYRSLSLMTFTRDQILKEIKISDADLRSYYDENKSQYFTPEKRHVFQYILKEESDAKKLISWLKEKKTDAFIKKNLPATALSSDFGFVQENELIDDLAMPVFEAAKNAVIGPVLIDEDYQVLVVKDIQKERQQSFAAVKDRIFKEIQSERLEDHYPAVYQKMDDMFAAGSSLENVARAFSAKIDKFQQIAYGTADALNVELMQEAFQLDKDMESGIFEVDGGFAVIRVDAISPARPKTFEESRTELVAIWRQEQQIQMAAERADRLVHSFAGAKKERQPLETRQGLLASFSTPVVSEVFSSRSLKDVHKISIKDGFVVYKLTGIKPAEISGNQQVVRAMQSLLNDAAKEELSAAFIMDLKAYYGASIDHDALQKVVTRIVGVSSESEGE